MFKKNDIFFYTLLLLLILFPFLNNIFSGYFDNAHVNLEDSKIKVQIGKNYVKYLDSNIDSIYTIQQNGAEFKLEVKNKTIKVLHSNCKSQICKKTGKITATSNIKQIICIPNKTIISFERPINSEEKIKDELDGISG